MPRGQSRRRSPRHNPLRVGVFTALLLLPVLIVLHLPLVAALVPGALATAASSLIHEDERPALPAAEIVSVDDPYELARVAGAIEVESKSRRVA